MSDLKSHGKEKSKPLHTLFNILFVLAVFYIFYCLALFLLQRHIMFPRYLIHVPEEGEKEMQGIERIWLNTSYGKVEAWFLPPDINHSKMPSPAVIFAHGNGEIIDIWPEALKGFTDLGIGLLLVEYPGYGRSQGNPSQRSITETFINAYDYLISREDVDPSRIILLGRSIGGGAICALAAERKSAALILMSTFTSARSFASKFLAPGFIVRDTFNNLSIVSSYTGPILIIHGKSDTIVSYRHAISLYRAAKNGKMLTYNSNHNDCPPDWDIFWQDVASFLRNVEIIDRID